VLEVDAVAAGGAALGVAAHSQLRELGAERLEQEQPADERLARLDDQLDHLVRLEQAHDAGQHAQHAVGPARRRQLGRRGLRVEAAVARSLVGDERGELPVEAEDRRVHDRLALAHGRVVQQVAGGEVVRAVHDHVVVADQVEDVVGVQPGRVRDHVHVRVQRLDRALRGLDLRLADALRVVDHLALEVAEVDLVVVDDPERADAGRREVQGRGRAEPACADQQDLGLEQLLLPLQADLGDQEVPRVALPLLGREGDRALEVVAAVLPEREAAGHHRDVVVAEVVHHGLRGERGAVLRRAVRDHAPAAVGDRLLDAGLEVAAGHVHRTGDVALLELLLLAHVEDHGRLVGVAVAPRVLEDLVDLCRVELLEPGASLLDQLLA